MIELNTLIGTEIQIKDLSIQEAIAKLKYLCDCQHYRDLKFYEDNILMEDE